MQVLAYLPSPSQGVWHLGPIPVRAYALCIVAGILVAIWLTTRRWVERGGDPDHVWDISGWAIVLGIIGGRLYHLATDPELYFLGRPGTSPINAFKIWDGGLGIWGAIALGTLGAYIGCRRRGIDLRVFADAAVPGVIFAQALGRWGNWFNNELFGDRTTLPWGLQVHCLVGGRLALGGANGQYNCPAGSGTLTGHFQPTFLYESIWDVGIGIGLLLLDRRLRLGRGNVMALYVMGYTAGRGWIEALRSDPANHFLGVRINDWVAIVVFLAALGYFLRHDGFHAARESSPYYAQRAGADGVLTAGTDELADGSDGSADGSDGDLADSTHDGSADGADGQHVVREVSADVGHDD